MITSYPLKDRSIKSFLKITRLVISSTIPKQCNPVHGILIPTSQLELVEDNLIKNNNHLINIFHPYSKSQIKASLSRSMIGTIFDKSIGLAGIDRKNSMNGKPLISWDIFDDVNKFNLKG